MEIRPVKQTESRIAGKARAEAVGGPPDADRIELGSSPRPADRYRNALAPPAAVARRKAEEITSSPGGTLGRLVSCDENYAGASQ
ncbi:MAG: hypothetical protein HY319_26890 [Armatimonadetes bacterium]|nr:hypothetical protein [Armatimonadota bacterium]